MISSSGDLSGHKTKHVYLVQERDVDFLHLDQDIFQPSLPIPLPT